MIRIAGSERDFGFLVASRSVPQELLGFELYKTREWLGKFWADGNPKVRRIGRLSYAPGSGLNLMLEGALKGHEEPGGFIVPLIRGTLGGESPVALFGCHAYTDASFGRLTSYRTLISSDHALLGHSRVVPDKPLFRFVRVGFTQLDDWLPAPYVRGPKDTDSHIQLEFKPADLSLMATWDGISFAAKAWCTRHLPPRREGDSTYLKHPYEIQLTSAAPVTYQWIIKVTAMIRGFRMLVLDHATYPTNLSASPDDPAVKGARALERDCMILARVEIPAVLLQSKSWRRLRYEQVVDHLPRAFQLWFDKAESLQVAVARHGECLLNDGARAESVFLAVTQTLEHLHGVLHPGVTRLCGEAVWDKYMTWLSEYAPSSIFACTGDESVRDTVINFSRGLNRLPFRDRLRSLFLRIPADRLASVLDNPRDVGEGLDATLKSIEVTRNYLTHYSRKERKAKSGAGLEALTLTCWAALVNALWDQLELPESIRGDAAILAKKSAFLVNGRTAFW